MLNKRTMQDYIVRKEEATMYERTNTKVHEVLRGMVIVPKYVELYCNAELVKKYNYTDYNKAWLIEHYTRDIKLVIDMSYNPCTQILKILVK